MGSAMVDHLLRWARRPDVGLDAIKVDAADVDAQRFYERHGFTGIEPTTGERAFYFHQELIS
jgi:GNAT superfamily N-acetyltransferase